MAMKIAIAGLKHGHIQGVLQAARQDPSVEIAAVAESDPITRERYERDFGLDIRYDSHTQLLESAAFNMLVVCEAFADRGEAVIAGLKAGKHIFSDKPLCTAESELWEIVRLSRENDLEVGVDFSLRHFWFQTAAPIQQGEIGEIVTCITSGPHSLAYQVRPKWYYRPGKHGGIINDLLGHGVDYIQWIAGQRMTAVLSAAGAKAGVPQEPDFESFGQAYYRMEGGATAFGQVDYLIPEGHASNWRCFIQGASGDALVDDRNGLLLRPSGQKERYLEPATDPRWQHPFTDLAHYLLEGAPMLRTADEGLQCSLATLIAQRAADTGQCGLDIPKV
ncbi:MAG: Gfo/Idh/MocA family oxidoreductase [Armatimonadetes bacterium]|nr:Gfo/Idh/MocA family oxidoreductase [Armatimonadota bacterium]